MGIGGQERCWAEPRLLISPQVPWSSGRDCPRSLRTWAGSEMPRSMWRELSRSEGAEGRREGARMAQSAPLS